MLGRRVLLSKIAVLCAPFRAAASTLPSAFDVGAVRESPRLELPPLADGWRRLYLCRHGETEWNAANRIQGSTDIALNAIGKQQAQQLARLLQDETIDVVVSSALSRASATADAVAALHPSAPRIREARFNEMCFGGLEGQSLEAGSQLRATYDVLLKEWAAGQTGSAFPGERGESPDIVAERTLAGLRDLGLLPPLAGGQPVECPRHVCLVAHGRLNKIVLAALQGSVARCSEIQQVRHEKYT